MHNERIQHIVCDVESHLTMTLTVGSRENPDTRGSMLLGALSVALQPPGQPPGRPQPCDRRLLLLLADIAVTAVGVASCARLSSNFCTNCLQHRKNRYRCSIKRHTIKILEEKRRQPDMGP